jgi:hypothetical protein
MCSSAAAKQLAAPVNRARRRLRPNAIITSGAWGSKETKMILQAVLVISSLIVAFLIFATVIVIRRDKQANRRRAQQADQILAALYGSAISRTEPGLQRPSPAPGTGVARSR